MSDRSSFFVLLLGLSLGIVILGLAISYTGAVNFSLYELVVEKPRIEKPVDASQTLLPLMSNPTLCLSCHDKAQTKGFHIPAKIMKVDENKGLRRRICVDCHGTRGASATEQMSDTDKIRLQNDSSYRLDSNIPHAIHRKKVELGAMNCETCHGGKEGEIVIPLPDTSAGQILVCEKCHVPKDNGNYIAIHVEYGSKTCNTCHTGNLVDIHKKATSKLGV